MSFMHTSLHGRVSGNPTKDDRNWEWAEEAGSKWDCGSGSPRAGRQRGADPWWCLQDSELPGGGDKGAIVTTFSFWRNWDGTLLGRNSGQVVDLRRLKG